MRFTVLIAILTLIFTLSARDYKGAAAMNNTRLVYNDTIRVDSLSAVWTQAFAIDQGVNLILELEADDDSTAGFADDSACVSVELYQAIPETRDNIGYWKLYKSKNDPDSTYPGTDFFLFDSLDITDMDTAAVFFRDTTSFTQRSGGGKIMVYGDSVVTADTLSKFTALEYLAFTPDLTPALALKFTGLSPNKTEGVGSLWIIRVYQMYGDPVKAE